MDLESSVEDEGMSDIVASMLGWAEFQYWGEFVDVSCKDILGADDEQLILEASAGSCK